jgi:hypothetical protein
MSPTSSERGNLTVPSARFDNAWICALNVAARIFGTCFGVAGLTFLAVAALHSEHRVASVALGLFMVAVGIATWIARPITQSTVDSLRGNRGSDGN